MTVRDLILALEDLDDKDLEIMAISEEHNMGCVALDVIFRKERVYTMSGDIRSSVYVMYGEY